MLTFFSEGIGKWFIAIERVILPRNQGEQIELKVEKQEYFSYISDVDNELHRLFSVGRFYTHFKDSTVEKVMSDICLTTELQSFIESDKND